MPQHDEVCELCLPVCSLRVRVKRCRALDGRQVSHLSEI